MLQCSVRYWALQQTRDELCVVLMEQPESLPSTTLWTRPVRQAFVADPPHGHTQTPIERLAHVISLLWKFTKLWERINCRCDHCIFFCLLLINLQMFFFFKQNIFREEQIIIRSSVIGSIFIKISLTVEYT